jgi:hypothetical protein
MTKETKNKIETTLAIISITLFGAEIIGRWLYEPNPWWTEYASVLAWTLLVGILIFRFFAQKSE